MRSIRSTFFGCVALASPQYPLILVPQDKGNESAACLDGSPYGFYFAPSTTNSTKWTIFTQGGGWCYDEEDCLARSKTFLGSSESYALSGELPPGLCRNPFEDGSMDNDCNYIYMNYCDGASFAGYRAEPWPVPSDPSQVLYFRGSRNFDAVIDFAFEHGMDKATEFVLAGQSAGGLSTYLHIDEVAKRLAKEAPDCEIVRALPWDGYFLEANDTSGEDVYASQIRYLYHMQHIRGSGDMLQSCLDAYKGDEYRCFMSPHMQEFVKTPLFAFNSKYDAYQLEYILDANFSQKANAGAVLKYGEEFLKQFMPFEQDQSNGAFITSCICHGCPWTDLELEGKTAFQHYADWYYGKTTGSAAIHIDSRRPNGDGSFHFAPIPNPGPDTAPGVCQPFPYEDSLLV